MIRPFFRDWLDTIAMPVEPEGNYMTTKTDPSVRPEETEIITKTPIGSVPLSRTMRKPEAYQGGKLNTSNGKSNRMD